MITRPLDLASRLRPEPRSSDGLFFVNGGFIVLYFFLFASPYVLSPAVGINFRLPEVPGASTSVQMATHYITVDDSGLILGRNGRMNLAELRAWLTDEAKTVKGPALRVLASRTAQLDLLAQIMDAARAVGFEVSFAAVKPAGGGSEGKKG